ncbi:hypothetical protein Acy02nite_60990 [Actinoplanes cyaneus]|uniref:Hemerythrin-like domain-containing protein n=1 Tax=Actinoplanes cyaneus TaxID=52696 RepID=A0A919IRI2_9ACTN|nr:hemerythrin domain-containing protein [Actinoplanes cyaneus]MCW2141701.1 Hemerythrin HHE cation binding domain-containing protein [Actinoplanes cyaneus]GID68218.1 hypothetical protein Acy02nite_60990 [Actinoplanes cyaneus]
MAVPLNPAAPADIPDTDEMKVIHKALRREFRLLAPIVATVSPGDQAASETVVRHAKLMLAMLHEHHESEDEYIWPLLHQRLPDRDAIIDTMQQQHETLAELIDQITAGLTRWAGVADPQTGAGLAKHLEELAALLDEHLDLEESNVLPLVREHLSVPEWKAPQAAAMKNLPSDFKSLMILAGVVLEDATPAERHWFLHEMPAPARAIYKMIGTRMYAANVRAVRATLPAAPAS